VVISITVTVNLNHTGSRSVWFVRWTVQHCAGEVRRTWWPVRSRGHGEGPTAAAAKPHLRLSRTVPTLSHRWPVGAGTSDRGGRSTGRYCAVPGQAARRCRQVPTYLRLRQEEAATKVWKQGERINPFTAVPVMALHFAILV